MEHNQTEILFFGIDVEIAEFAYNTIFSDYSLSSAVCCVVDIYHLKKSRLS